MQNQEPLLPLKPGTVITKELLLKIVDLAEAQILAFGFSHDKEKTCLYRKNRERDDPYRCVFGLFIPDEKYHLRMESSLASEVCEGWYNPLVGGPGALGKAFWDDLQEAHDHAVRLVDGGPCIRTFQSMMRDLRDQIDVGKYVYTVGAVV